ncbi:LysR family transcriptional regulator [Grimontia kaedaensis]|uniref:LysR family transcriptional regulator n=1 Tax=Grimontia kaedaensis TaxID=2872157 RepID=A0ABY4X084_9GAMM|nr:LysR family transcriptional regulator [Grimontia kaedaensis]
MKLQYLKGLTIFATVADQGSFSAAAKFLRINRSAVSEQIRNLESSLGVRLIQRTTRQLSLTVDGQALYPSAKAIAQGLAEAEENLNHNKPEGTIRITAPHDFAVTWLLPKIHIFKKLHPQIQLDYILSFDKIDIVKEGIDLALRVSHIEEEGYIARPLFPDKIGLYCSPALINEMGQTPTIDNISSFPWILYGALAPNNVIPLSNGSCNISLQPENFDKTNSPTLMREIILDGKAVGFQRERAMIEKVETGQVVHILPEWYQRDICCHLLYPSRKNLSLRTRLLIEYLLEYAE